MAMTNAERQRAWRNRKREAESRQPRRRGEAADRIARQEQISARTVYRSAHYARAIDTISAAYPRLAQMILQGPGRRLYLGNRLVGHRITILLADILRDDPEGFAEHALPLFRDRYTGDPVEIR